MNVWRRGRSVYELVREELGEVPRVDKLAGVIRMYGAHRSGRRTSARVEERVEFGEKAFDAGRGVGARFEEIDHLESGMVVNQDQEVPVSAAGGHERARNVGVDKSARIRGRVAGTCVGETRRVGFGARMAWPDFGSAERGRRV
eukprot:6206027-Pleurochrysis_carterae.AAC.3